ncbi:ROK family protein [Streptomyces sp. LMG1-1-1.1]|uniref:ROK family protein n=1 Tax=Streptomyces sp. LMG1-1-1.1 TaxID=3135245 RepID=UPI00346660CF
MGGLAILAANLRWQGVPVQDWLAEHLDLPAAFGHDVRAGGLAEARAGADRSCADFLHVPVGTGITAAAFTGRRPCAHRGATAGPANWATSSYGPGVTASTAADRDA